MKKIYALGLVIILGIILALNFSLIFNQSGTVAEKEISNHYIEQGVEETGAINIVTAILFDYRGFDTLGEATVIFIAASTISFLVSRRRIFISHNNFSPLVHQSVSLVLPFLYVLGIYLIFYGHLSPGGGFAGGVVLATIFILLTVSFGLRHTREEEAMQTRSLVENTGALGFVGIGLLGVVVGSSFLANGQAGFGLGTPGQLISAGTIPGLNLMTGMKVGAGLAIIFYSLVKEE